jgi:hypothetical protein
MALEQSCLASNQACSPSLFVLDTHTSLLAKFADYQASGTAAGGFADKNVGRAQIAYKL